eukprot:scaffold1062_cov119-Isochrysis_galbana.AAC.5
MLRLKRALTSIGPNQRACSRSRSRPSRPQAARRASRVTQHVRTRTHMRLVGAHRERKGGTPAHGHMAWAQRRGWLGRASA